MPRFPSFGALVAAVALALPTSAQDLDDLRVRALAALGGQNQPPSRGRILSAAWGVVHTVDRDGRIVGPPARSIARASHGCPLCHRDLVPVALWREPVGIDSAG